MALFYPLRVGPLAVTGSVADIYSPGTLTGGVNSESGANQRALLNLIHVANTTAGALTIEIYIGATGGNASGTEIVKGLSIPANDFVQIPLQRCVVNYGDYVTAKGSSTGLTITLAGELGVA
jgi:hypothetical protein